MLPPGRPLPPSVHPPNPLSVCRRAMETKRNIELAGPLAGVKVLEIAAIGPGPFAGMLLADMGADVVRIDRPPAAPAAQPSRDVLARGRRSLALDLKDGEATPIALALVERADVLIEGFRPGVMERLGLGPTECAARNRRLVYGRMTGWGQDGPLAGRAGHDIDYIAVSGALRPIGSADRPPSVPLNLVGDFGGGGVMLAFGVVCALLERERSGRGQVVDAAMVDGAATLTAMFHGMLATGSWSDERESNLLDGAAPFYRAYRCADGEFVAVGALEPRFYGELLRTLELDPDRWPQDRREDWPEQAASLAALFATRTREEWTDRFEGVDACVAPVLSLAEAPRHPHLLARATFVEREGLLQPAPAPRFSRTPGVLSRPPVLPGQHSNEILAEIGISPDRVTALRERGVLR